MADSHVVVFDVNVYMDVAHLIGPGFTVKRFTDLAAKHASAPCGNTDRRIDSLRALAVSTTGRFAGLDSLAVWTSNHIEDLLYTKLSQPLAAPTPERRGYGWADEDASDFVNDLGDYLLDFSDGDSCGDVVISRGAPPLEHEDGLVYATSLEAGYGDVDLLRYCVTNDGNFRRDAPYSDVHTLYAYEWVNLVRESRRRLAATPPTPAP